MAGTLGVKSSCNNTSLFSTAFTPANTLYIPYVGGKVMILSSLGSQKVLKIRSRTSSLPFPNRICLGETFFCSANTSFKLLCCGSGYLFTPVSNGLSLASKKIMLEPSDTYSSLAEEYGLNTFTLSLTRSATLNVVFILIFLNFLA